MMKEFKADTWAFDVIDGWVFLREHGDSYYPLGTEIYSYTKDGKGRMSSKLPRLLDHDPFNNTKPPEHKIDWRKVPRDTPVLAGNSDTTHNRYFSHVDAIGNFWCFYDNKKSYESAGINPWKHIKLNCETNPEWLAAEE